jgi:hypothetical protein
LRRAYSAAESEGQMPVRIQDNAKNGENTRCAETTSAKQENITAYGYLKVYICL